MEDLNNEREIIKILTTIKIVSYFPIRMVLLQDIATNRNKYITRYDTTGKKYGSIFNKKNSNSNIRGKEQCIESFDVLYNCIILNMLSSKELYYI
jgi:hypothetical protein